MLLLEFKFPVQVQAKLLLELNITLLNNAVEIVFPTIPFQTFPLKSAVTLQTIREASSDAATEP